MPQRCGGAPPATPPLPLRACRRRAPRVSASSSPGSIRFENEIARDEHPHRKPRPDGERRLDIEMTFDTGLTTLLDGVLRPVADGAKQADRTRVEKGQSGCVSVDIGVEAN